VILWLGAKFLQSLEGIRGGSGRPHRDGQQQRRVLLLGRLLKGGRVLLTGRVECFWCSVGLGRWLAVVLLAVVGGLDIGLLLWGAADIKQCLAQLALGIA